MSTPISIVLLGKIPGHVAAVREIVKPDHEVNHYFNNVDSAAAELPDLVASGAVDVGIVGGNFSPAEFEQVLQAEGAKDIPWLKPDPEAMKKAAAAGVGPPSSEMVAARLRKGLDAHQGEIGEGKSKGEIWFF